MAPVQRLRESADSSPKDRRLSRPLLFPIQTAPVTNAPVRLQLRLSRLMAVNDSGRVIHVAALTRG
jgi:hypothetical protein